MNIKFSSVTELKERLLPALKIRSKALRKQNIILSEEELWTYFVNNYWKNANNLNLYEMVNDILNKDIENSKQNIKEGASYE